MLAFNCNRCGRPNQAAEASTGTATRCVHCRNFVVVPSEVAAEIPEAFAASPLPEGQESPEGFGVFSQSEARQSAKRSDEALRRLTWLRIVVTVGAVVGAALGAGLGAVRFHGDLAETTTAVIGALIGLLIGVTFGVIGGLSYAVDRKAGGRKQPTNLLAKLMLTHGEPADVLDIVAMLLGFAGERGLRRVEPWNLILVGMILGALAGGVYGAEVALQGMDDVWISWWTVIGGVVGGLAGGGSCMMLTIGLWRRK